MSWQNRIVEQRMVPIADLKANPQNWRLHPASQRAALDELLGKVGVVQGVIYNKRTERLVDGHLRLDMAEKAGIEALPVTVVDLSEDEERLVLATLDPIGAMAQIDDEIVSTLVRSIEDQSGRLGEVMASIAPDNFHLPPDAAGTVVDEDIADKVSFVTCPKCGHEFPR